MKDPSECTPLYWSTPWLNAIAIGLRLGLPAWIFGLVSTDNFYALFSVWTHIPANAWEPILEPRTVLNDYTQADVTLVFEDPVDQHGHRVLWTEQYFVIDVVTNAMI